MALVICSECGAQVSDLAQSCVRCGAPVSQNATVRAVKTPVTTTQSTAKSIKAQIAVGSLMVLCGFMLMLAGASSSAGGLVATVGLLLAGLIVLLLGALRRWWHHA